MSVSGQKDGNSESVRCIQPTVSWDVFFLALFYVIAQETVEAVPAGSPAALYATLDTACDVKSSISQHVNPLSPPLALLSFP